MIPIHELLSRIRWDKGFGQGEFVIGYYDRVEDAIIRIVPGLVSGVLQRGMAGLGEGRLCVLSHKDIGLLIHAPQANDEALARKLHGAGVIAVGAAPLPHVMIRLFGLGVPTVIVSNEQLLGVGNRD